MRVLAALAIPVLFAAACLDATDDLPEGEDGTGDTDLVQVDDKADATSELRTRIDGLTVWIDPSVVATARDSHGRHWKLGGRASRNLDEVFSSVPDDAFGEARLTGLRTFDLLLDDHELNSIASGLPLFVTVTPKTGVGATAGVWLRPRLAHFSGSTAIRLDPAITPVSVGGELVYRGGGHASTGYAGLAVTGAQVSAIDAGTWKLDYRYDALGQLAATAGASVTATATKASTTATKTAIVRFDVTRLGLTREDPTRWSAVCAAAVRTCLAGLPAGALDTGACGEYRQVQACQLEG